MGWYNATIGPRRSRFNQLMNSSVCVRCCSFLTSSLFFYSFFRFSGHIKRSFGVMIHSLSIYDSLWSWPPFLTLSILLPNQHRSDSRRAHEKNSFKSYDAMFESCPRYILCCAADDLYINRVSFDRYRFLLEWENINQNEGFNSKATTTTKKLIRTLQDGKMSKIFFLSQQKQTVRVLFPSALRCSLGFIFVFAFLRWLVDDGWLLQDWSLFTRK